MQNELQAPQNRLHASCFVFKPALFWLQALHFVSNNKYLAFTSTENSFFFKQSQNGKLVLNETFTICIIKSNLIKNRTIFLFYKFFQIPSLMNNYCSFTKVDKFYIILQMVHLQILVQGNPKCLI